MLRVAIVGFGYWGPNYARILSGSVPGARLVACADSSAPKLAQFRAQHPEARIYADVESLVADGDVDAAIVATPTTTHRQVAEPLLRAGIAVLVEKPLAASSADAEAILAVAREVDGLLMVGHTFLFNPAVRMIKRYIDEGSLGEILYLYFHRTGLGPIRQDVNALWDLAPHDLSMLRYWLSAEPLEVVARGQSYLRPGTEDVCFLTLRYPQKVIASVHVSWLDPIKVRRAIVVGDRKMVLFDDVDSSEKLRIYDKGASYQPTGADYAEFVTSVRDGDIVIPRVDAVEPLREQLSHFIQCVSQKTPPIADGEAGVAVVRILEAAQMDLERSGIGRAVAT
jgi:predicted dehydrogenase